MPKDASPDGGAPGRNPALVRVSGMQAKLHRWAVAEPGCRFDDLYNFACDPATLLVAYRRVAGNRGARTAGVDGLTVADVERETGVPGFLDDLRAQLKAGSFRPLPVRERLIPKPSGGGKLRRLGIPTIADRVVQAALKLVLEPIFEADFQPVSYGYRPGRRAQDAIAEVQYYGTHGYHWVLDADIHACFDEIDHSALMGQVRNRIKDKRVLALVKAFLKAGVLTEHGQNQDTLTGVPQGGILSPLLANVALSVLDEHLHAAWQPGGALSTSSKRVHRRRTGRPNWRIIRYADDVVVMVHGTEADALQLREEVARVLATIGLRLSEAKTQVTHLDRGFDFLGFRIQRKRKRGTNKRYVYTFVADRAIRAVKEKIRALTHRTSQRDPEDLLKQINQITQGWANHFKHAVVKHVFATIDQVVWWRMARLLMVRHHWGWKQFRARHTDPTGRWTPIRAETTELRPMAKVPVTRYRYRGDRIPTPWAALPA
ncbi:MULTISPECIES: group II intron reverse transcriptase/maturase [unclassified Pseudofrankia]|uniref:group II intron reverse transcriptase/maturase n=1 Tax=unclassified Pseudofrankia TaxID=2994372 RepID=UPI0008DA5F30|nr:group II intron reverse transcriptase/maturase [Pseudofrankia sp. BMG5.36]OHV60770.1 group II intron reverse transcriptase/maturase [Pseudofrankia sp. BMG5.36]